MIRKLSSVMLIALVALLSARPLKAETILVDQSGMISGRQSYVIPIQVSGRGQVSVWLSDLGWLGAITDLSFSLSHAGSLIAANPRSQGLVTSAGSAALPKTFDLSEPGTYYAGISGTAAGAYNLGLYGIRIAFAAADTTAVSLPATALLLLSGLVWLVGVGNRRGVATVGEDFAAAA